MSHFFISYSHNDEKLATELQAKLADEGLLTWTDHQIPAGGEWRKLIDLAIEGSIGVLLIVSKDSMASTYVQYEWVYGMGKGKEIIPVSIDNTRPTSEGVHPKLEPLQWIISQDKLTTWQGDLISRLKDLAGVVEDFPPAIQKAIDLFDSVDMKDWKHAVQYLQQNRSPYAIEALAIGAKHDSYGVRERCGMIFARMMDPRGIPIMVEIYKNMDVKTKRQLLYLPIIRELKISEVQFKIIEFIEYIDSKKRDETPRLYAKPDSIATTLDIIMTEDGLKELKGLFTRLNSDSIWYKKLKPLLDKRDNKS